MKKLILVIILLVMVGCSAPTTKAELISTPMMTEQTSQPSETSTHTPEVKTSTPTLEQKSSTVSPTPGSILETIDLSDFVAAWNGGDVSKIRSFYTTDARFYSKADLQYLYQEQPIDVLVSDSSFTEQVANYEGMTLRIIGEPLMVYDKLVAFLYRWENQGEGYDGAALLRYEDGKIFLQTSLESDQLTPNPLDGSSDVQELNLDDLMRVWIDSDSVAAQAFYSENAVILSDEDLAQAAWRDFSRPPKLNQLLSHFAGWGPTILGEPKRLGDLAIFAWHWQQFDYPLGYGVRLVHFQDGKIDTDIRYAIRPWEAKGKPFMEP
jgi:hypothetical protein